MVVVSCLCVFVYFLAFYLFRLPHLEVHEWRRGGLHERIESTHSLNESAREKKRKQDGNGNKERRIVHR